MNFKLLDEIFNLVNGKKKEKQTKKAIRKYDK